MADAQRVEMLLGAAYTSMLEARGNRAKKIRRSLRRSWQYGGGKKKVAKLAVGAAFGAIFVGVSAATAGAGAPVIAALAIGGFMVGQMSDVGFAKLSGRKYRGKQKTQNWMDKYRSMNSEEQTENLQVTQERAHKTIRRAFEHYRRAVRKARAAQEAAQAAATDQTCDAAAEMVLSTLHVSHHFDKARTYEFPALFLCQTLLQTYKTYLRVWQTGEPNLRARAAEILDGHAQDTACESDPCFAVEPVQQGAALPHPTFWDATVIARKENELKELDDELTMAGFAPGAPAPPGARDAVQRAHALFQDAGKKYHVEHKSLRVKMKHGITNMWARKTSGERKAFVASKVVAAGLAAGGGGVSGGTASLDLPKFFDPLLEVGFEATQEAVDQIVDRATEDEELGGQSDIEHHKDAARAGAEGQSTIQKAAVHLFEIMKIMDALKTSEKATDCASAVERAREIYKIEHHLGKTQKYLGDSIAKVLMLGNDLKAKVDASKAANEQVFQLALRIVGRTSHGNCGKVCYGPANGQAFMPARRLT